MLLLPDIFTAFAIDAAAILPPPGDAFLLPYDADAATLAIIYLLPMLIRAC